jgi:carbon storage regulator CsrA
MLILRRKSQQSFVLALPDGTEITVAVVEIRSDSDALEVRIGIDAPRDVLIHRSEVWRFIRDEWIAQREEKTHAR